MRAAGKAGIVLGGYAAAFLLAAAAFYLRLRATANNPDAQASPGMDAFTDTLLFLFVFGAAALVPTGLGLFFSRLVRHFWRAASICALAFAATGVAASGFFWTARSHPPAPSLFNLAVTLSLERVVVAPLLTAAFLICAGFAPATRPRRAFVAAALCEGGAAAPFFVWVVYTAALAR